MEEGEEVLAVDLAMVEADHGAEGAFHTGVDPGALKPWDGGQALSNLHQLADTIALFKSVNRRVSASLSIFSKVALNGEPYAPCRG